MISSAWTNAMPLRIGRLLLDRRLHMDKTWWGNDQCHAMLEQLCVLLEYAIRFWKRDMLISIICLIQTTSCTIIGFRRSIPFSTSHVETLSCLGLLLCAQIAYIWWDCYCETHYWNRVCLLKTFAIWCESRGGESWWYFVSARMQFLSYGGTHRLARYCA